MNKKGHITCQIKNKQFQKNYRSTIKRVGIQESEFLRQSLRYMIAYVDEHNQMPPISAVRAGK